MSETVLTAEIGRRAGSSDARRLRADGKIPAVVYGHKKGPVHVTVRAGDEADLPAFYRPEDAGVVPAHAPRA